MKVEEWKRIFADNLLDILEEKGMTQRQLAIDSGVSASTISDCINRIRMPGLAAVINMAYALDVDVNELIDFDERIE